MCEEDSTKLVPVEHQALIEKKYPAFPSYFYPFAVADWSIEEPYLWERVGDACRSGFSVYSDSGHGDIAVIDNDGKLHRSNKLNMVYNREREVADWYVLGPYYGHDTPKLFIAAK